jgi:ATP-binding cassette subfamily F protein 3
MTMLQVSGVTKSYGDNTILDNVSFIVNPGDRLGLIGPNGCGKTTLLRIIAGQERPDGGSIRFSPPDLRMGFLQQGLIFAEGERVAGLLGAAASAADEAEREVARLAQTLATSEGAERARLMRAYSQALADLETLTAAQTSAHDAEAALAGLGLGGVPLHAPVATLSGGQKTRLGLARLLLHNPGLLLLDEPTNHLDIQALQWLEEWLRGFRGAALIVSHDRTFLDRTVTGILELDSATHRVSEYAGNYSDYVAEWERSHAKQWAQWRD